MGLHLRAYYAFGGRRGDAAGRRVPGGTVLHRPVPGGRAVLAFWGTLRTGPTPATTSTTSKTSWPAAWAIDHRTGHGLGALLPLPARGADLLPYFLDSPPLRKALALAAFLAAMTTFCAVAGRVAACPGSAPWPACGCPVPGQGHPTSSPPTRWCSNRGCCASAWPAPPVAPRPGRRARLPSSGPISWPSPPAAIWEAFLAYAPLLWGIVWLRAGHCPRRLAAMAAASTAFAPLSP